MRVLLQRVRFGSVSVDSQTVGTIDHGLVLLVGVGQNDTPADADRLAEKVAHLRIFNDEQGRFNRSLLDVRGGTLVVSQFTLYADARKGRRPCFTQAAAPDHARTLIDRFAAALQRLGVERVETGRFGAKMQVHLINDGPVTLWLDSAELS